MSYDCRYPSNKTTITISANYSTCTVQGVQTEIPYGVELVTDFDDYSRIDIDHAYNNNPTFAPATNADYHNNTTISVGLSEAFTLQNSQNEILEWNGEQLSGTMDIINSSMTTEGNTRVSTLILTVPSSDEYEFVPASGNGEVYVTMMNNTGYVRVSGQNICALHISADTSVQIDGDNVVYEAAYGANEKNAPLYTESGTGSEITIGANNAK